MDVALKLIGFLLTIGIVVTWHELGHYWAAKWAGVKVLRFSLGFGNVLKRWYRGSDREEWALSAIPMGGYVKMLDEREGGVHPSERGRAFNNQSLLKRNIIVAAGPFANFVLAVVLLTVLNLTGVSETRALIDAPTIGSAADQSGLRAGDEILRINGEGVEGWSDARWKLLVSAGSSVEMEIKTARGGERTIQLAVSAPGELDTADPVDQTGVRSFNPLPAVIESVVNGGRGAAAGLRANDEIVSVDGETIKRWTELSRIVAQSPEKPLTLSVQRGKEKIDIVATPSATVTKDGKSVGRLGIQVRFDEKLIRDTQRTVHYGPVVAIQRALSRTWELSIFTLKMLGKMVTGEASLKNISGPVTMADYAGQSIQSGVVGFLAFLSLISISIGVLNLLPIPMLDGGHLLYHAVEAVRGAPPTLSMLEWGHRIGLGVVVALMGLAFYNDITRYFIG